jgi:hypothetical protein
MHWSFGAIALAVGIGAAALWGAWWLWWRLPKRQADRLSLKIRDAKGRADVEDNFRKTVGQLLGGATVLVGAGFAYLQFSQQQQASHELLISNQVAKGFEQLGSDKVVVRLGGIYALEGVMNTSEQYHQSVLEALCAFVRDSTRIEIGDRPPATEIQAALTVIGRRRLVETESVVVNLADAHIGKTDLIKAMLRYADLSRAGLSRTDLRYANLRDAHLIGAKLINANLGYADLSDAAISQTQLNEACGTETKLPRGLNLKPCSP